MTIYALSSGPGTSGVAVIRLSGQDTSKVIKLFRLISKLTKSNKYEFCLSHMSSLMIIIASPILKKRKIESIFWYTHKGPNNFLKKIFLMKASIYTNKIITASKNSFPKNITGPSLISFKFLIHFTFCVLILFLCIFLNVSLLS